MRFPPLLLLLALIGTLSGALAFTRMLGRRPTLLKIAPHVPPGAITRTLEAFKLFPPVIAVGAVGAVGALVVLKQRELGKVDLDEERAVMQKYIDEIRATMQELLSDIKELQAGVQQMLSRAFALLQEQLQDTTADESALELKIQEARREATSDPLALALKHARADLWNDVTADSLELRSEVKVLKAMMLALLGLFDMKQQEQQDKRQAIDQVLMELKAQDAQYKKTTDFLAHKLDSGTAAFLQDWWSWAQVEWQKGEEARSNHKMVKLVRAVTRDVRVDFKEQRAMFHVWQDSRAGYL